MEEKIWSFLLSRIGNECGVAALMGSLYVESRLNPVCLQDSYSRRNNITSEEYTKMVDEGRINREDFAHDGAGYGIAQWTYYSRKEALYSSVKSAKKSIGDLDAQLEFLWKEIQTYKTVMEAMKNATDVYTPAAVITRRFEKPAKITEVFIQTRAKLGETYLNKYASKGQRVKAKVNVNIRSGNGKNYTKLGELKEGESCRWVATSENKWYAIEYKNGVSWVDSTYAELI